MSEKLSKGPWHHNTKTVADNHARVLRANRVPYSNKFNQVTVKKLKNGYGVYLTR